MPVSSLSLRSGNMAKLAVLSFLTTGAVAAAGPYQLKNTYSDTFFDAFDFYTGPDPNNGFVTYQDRATATGDGVISYDGTYNYMGVDGSSQLDPSGPGRGATKLISKDTFNHGLFVAEITNMPGGMCGTVPGYYIGGGKGEINVISGLDDGNTNTLSLFTTGPFDVVGNHGTGNQQSTTCETGCSTTDTDNQAYGLNFNSNDGGVFATQWDSDGVNIWFWKGSNGLPDDIQSANPDPTGWGAPLAAFSGTSSLDGILADGKIVFDTSFCGTLLESLWSQSDCGSLAATCADYVAANPTDFDQNYWAVSYLSIFQKADDTPVPPTVPSSSSSDPAAISSTQAAAAPSSVVPVPDVPAASSSEAAATTTVAVPAPDVPAASTTAPSTPTGPAVPDVAAFSYYGCVKDFDPRLLIDDHWDSDPMTLELCAAYCGAFSYFAVEYTRECYCGNSFNGPLTRLAESECSLQCSGDGKEICGGYMTLSLYTKNAIPVAPGASSTEVAPGSPASTAIDSSPSTTEAADPSSPTTTVDVDDSTTTTADSSAPTTDINVPGSDPALTTSAAVADPIAASSTVDAVLSSTSTDIAEPTATPEPCMEWESMGCYSSDSGFTGFSLLEYDSNENSVAYCTAMCDSESSKFAAMYDGDCYCAEGDMASATTHLAPESCSIPCPGDGSKFCGGDVKIPKRRAASRAKRDGGDVPVTELFNIYAKKACAVSSVAPVLASSTMVIDPSTSVATPVDNIAVSTSGSEPKPTPISNSIMTTTPGASVIVTVAPEPTTTLYGTSVIYTTKTYTITSCAATVTNCPLGSTSVTSFPVTTVYPVTGSPSTTAPPKMTISTVYATSVYTITSCAKTVTDCPAVIGKLTTQIVSLYTTVCPVSPAPTAPATIPVISHPSVDLITTVIVTTYVNICPGGLTTMTTSLTKTLVSGGPTASIPMVTSTATVTISGSIKTLTLTVPSTPTTTGSSTMKGNVGMFTPVPVVVTTTMVVVPVPVTTGTNPMYPTGAAGGNGTAGCPGCGKASATGTGAVPSSTGKITSDGMGRWEWSALAGVVAIMGVAIVL